MFSSVKVIFEPRSVREKWKSWTPILINLFLFHLIGWSKSSSPLTTVHATIHVLSPQYLTSTSSLESIIGRNFMFKLTDGTNELTDFISLLSIFCLTRETATIDWICDGIYWLDRSTLDKNRQVRALLGNETGRSWDVLLLTEWRWTKDVGEG